MDVESHGYLLAPGEGPAVWFLGERLTMKATSEQTGGAFALVEDLAAPGGEPPVHVHTREDEAFFLLEGELDVTCGERTLAASAGSFVLLPRGIPHTFRVQGGRPARFLALFTPGGFERFFVEGGQPAQAPTPPPAHQPPDLSKLLELAARYGLDLPTLTVGAP
ncbi:MAG TPA: quercetin 2,3-dioxygenase [Actinomycetes bacterium]|jgi:quercetin dioxygenase-like cupin family protein|nr:quercetin 2,3-dioxygenase [Actinomycetes bacterium]